MHLGLIGGIGPAATVSYYLKLVERCREDGVPLVLTIVNADIQTLALNAQAGRRDEQAAIYAKIIEQLRASGAKAVAITSIGGSFCEDETRALSSLPLVSAIDALDDYFVACGIETIGILGTEPVMRSHLFGRMTRTKTVVPDGRISQVGQTYVDMAIAGCATDTARDVFFSAGRDMIQKQGADVILLAGTDLGLAFGGQDPGFPIVDAIDIHVGQLFRLATDALKLQDLSQ